MVTEYSFDVWIRSTIPKAIGYRIGNNQKAGGNTKWGL
jgi:hypothetical protein